MVLASIASDDKEDGIRATRRKEPKHIDKDVDLPDRDRLADIDKNGLAVGARVDTASTLSGLYVSVVTPIGTGVMFSGGTPSRAICVRIASLCAKT